MSKKDIPKEFSKIRINEFEKLVNVIDDENQFYSHVKKIITYLETDEIIILVKILKKVLILILMNHKNKKKKNSRRFN